MQLRNVSRLQLSGKRSVQENRAEWLLALWLLPFALFLRKRPGILCTQCPFAELLSLRPHVTALSPRDVCPVCSKDLSFFMSQTTRKEGLKVLP